MPNSSYSSTRIPGYKLEALLGQGAMAIVYRATQTATGKAVAVKLLRSEHLDRQDLRQRFQREADLASKIHHPNIAGVEFAGEYNNIPYMVMDLLDPVSLGDRVEQSGPLPVADAIDITIKVLDALDLLHQRDIVHRDLKAENVLFSQDGTPLLSDLGLAFTPSNSRITSIGTGPLGTPNYMAPEQWLGEAGDQQTDVFASGVLLYHLLSGAFPFPANSPQAVMSRLLSDNPEPLPDFIKPKHVHDQLEAFIIKALSLDPNGRYPSASLMKEQLQAIASLLNSPRPSLLGYSDISEAFDEPLVPEPLSNIPPPRRNTNPGLRTPPQTFSHAEPRFIPPKIQPNTSRLHIQSQSAPPPLHNNNSNNSDINQFDNIFAERPVTDSSLILDDMEDDAPNILLEQDFFDEADLDVNFIPTVDQDALKAAQSLSQFGNSDPSPLPFHSSQDSAISLKPSFPSPVSKPVKDNTPMNLNDEKNPQKLAINPLEIAPGSYWVGKRTPGDFFYANPYLRTFKGNGQEFNLIIDPGSSCDFSIVQAKSSRIIGNLSKIHAAFINHQDPDVGSSVGPLIARYSPNAYCLCTEDTWRLVQHYNVPRERFVPLEKYPNGFKLPTGHKLIPVPSPFCHFVGAMMIYDPETYVLYSGDLFGGLTDKAAKGMWADESDWVGMRAFHQIYMPTRGALVNAIRNIRAIKGELKIIAPQHGRLLAGDIMHDFMHRLETLPVGLDILSDRQTTPDELLAWSSVLKRVVNTASGLTSKDVFSMVLSDRSLEGLIKDNDGSLEIKNMGKYCIEQSLRTICDQLGDKDIEGMLKYEAIFATNELGLPTPNMDIDEGEAPHSKGSMLGKVD